MRHGRRACLLLGLIRERGKNVPSSQVKWKRAICGDFLTKSKYDFQNPNLRACSTKPRKVFETSNTKRKFKSPRESACRIDIRIWIGRIRSYASPIGWRSAREKRMRHAIRGQKATGRKLSSIPPLQFTFASERALYRGGNQRLINLVRKTRCILA
jgi:hypothetical protein